MVASRKSVRVSAVSDRRLYVSITVCAVIRSPREAVGENTPFGGCAIREIKMSGTAVGGGNYISRKIHFRYLSGVVSYCF